MNKTKMTLAILTIFSILPMVAQAELSSSVRVRIRNSSNYVYPCNAGIAKNPKAISQGVDFIRASWTPSQHNPAAQAGSGYATGGTVNSTSNPDLDFAFLTGLIGQGNRSYLSYNQLLPEDQMFNYILGQNQTGDAISINMGSDTYDSGFFITFCFKPSLNGNSGVPESLKFIHAKATHSAVPGSNSNYATDAKLMSMVEIKCTKDNGSIVQHYTPTGATTIDTLLTPFYGNSTIDMAPTGGIQIGSGVSLINGPGLNSGELPDDCRVRFYFIETSGGLRPHALVQSDIQIDLNATVSAL